MPDVVGSQVDDAWATLSDAGFTQGQQTTDYSPDVPENAVISADPATGTDVPAGSTVDLLVSNGLVNVPDVTGESTDDANAQLAEQLRLPVTLESDVTCTGGAVAGQTLAPGDQPQGSPITLRVCSG